MSAPVTASVPSAVAVPSAAAAVPTVTSAATAVPAVTSATAAMTMTVMATTAAPASADFIGGVQQTIGLHLERSSAGIRILRRLRDRSCSTERQRCNENDSNRSHFLVLLFAGIPPAQPI